MPTDRRRWTRVPVTLLVAVGIATIAADPGAVRAQAASVARPQLLDGWTYVGHLGERGKTPGDEDTLRFDGGLFHSTACEAYGFGRAPYTAAKVGDAIVFTAETTSEKEGRMVWTGTVTSHKLDGTATWTKPGQRAIEYWVKADLTH
ncbi:MAG: hypothetical protein IPK07_18010 [Deltaproteobacteria bacterium]|nr:hypothetical protein [Deltaproteobacteria bacterium]